MTREVPCTDTGSADKFSGIILYADNHLLALNKESGLLTQPAEPGRQNLEDMAKAWIKETCGKPGNVFLNPVHRLDRLVSGVVLFARTGKALSRINRDMRGRKIVKTYAAVVSPPPSAAEGGLRHFLAHSSHKSIIKGAALPGAKEAVLSYETVLASGELSLVEIRLETGRYHQIRAQFGHIGSPVLGDARYGSRVRMPHGNILLHHRRMTLVHPTTGIELSIESPLPRWWWPCIEPLGASDLKTVLTD